MTLNQASFTFDPSLSSFNVPLPDFFSKEASNIDDLAVGGFVFSPRDGRLLLIRRSIHESAFPLTWEVPGGGAERPPVDLTVLHSIVREVFEETGLHVTHIGRVIDSVNFMGRTGTRWKKYNFEVQVKDVEGIQLAELEHDEYKWATLEEITQGCEEGGWMSKMMSQQKESIFQAFVGRGEKNV